MKPSFIVFGVLAFLSVILFSMSYFTVQPNESVVVTRFGQISYVADSGLHFKLPFVNSTETFLTDIQEVHPINPSTGYPTGVNTYTIDNQEVDVTFNVFYRIPAANVSFVYTNVRDYRDRLYVMTIDRLKSQMGKVNVSSVAEKRGELRDLIKATLQNDAKSLGVEVTDFQLSDMQYTESYRNAISQAATAKAGVEAKEYAKQQAQKDAETAAIQAEGAANAVRATAKGAADARILQATAEAKAIEIQGAAQATAIKAQADALSANPRLVDLHKADRWDGKLPTSMLSNVMPFMNVDSKVSDQNQK
jgi:regulator of protease activity HflC (stomatin/prohibitin superfamily)